MWLLSYSGQRLILSKATFCKVLGRVVVVSSSVMSNFVTRGLWPTRLFCPWGSLGKNTGVGCQFLLQGIFKLVFPALQTDSLSPETPGNSLGRVLSPKYLILQIPSNQQARPLSLSLVLDWLLQGPHCSLPPKSWQGHLRSSSPIFCRRLGSCPTSQTLLHPEALWGFSFLLCQKCNPQRPALLWTKLPFVIATMGAFLQWCREDSSPLLPLLEW